MMKFLWGLIGTVTGGTTGTLLVASFVTFFTINSFLVAVLVALLCPIGFLIGAIFGVRLVPRVRRRFEHFTPAENKRRLLWSASVLSGVIGLNVILMQRILSNSEPPSDRVMLTNWDQNQTQLNQLAAMMEQDKSLKRVEANRYSSYDLLSPTGISPARDKQYQNLLGVINLPGGLVVDKKAHGIEFTYWAIGGGASSTTVKGYLYSRIPPTPLLQTLDHSSRLRRTFDLRNSVPARNGFRHIKGNWYLFYQYYPG